MATPPFIPTIKLDLDTRSQWGSGRNIVPGKYALKLKELKFHETKNPKKGNATYFIVNSTVTYCELAEGSKEAGFEPNDVASWLVNITNPSGPNNMGNFLLAALPHRNKADLTDAFVAAIVTPGTPENKEIIGVDMLADAYIIKTSSGGDFTKVDWTRYEETTETAAPAEDAAPALEQQAAPVAA